MEENSTKASRDRSAVSSSRTRAARTLPWKTVSRPSGRSASISLSSTTPAAWTTPVSGYVSGIAARTAAMASRSAASHATATASAPSSASSAISSEAPGVSGPRRPVRTRRWAPRWASQRATCPPSAPVPPVIRTVPCGCHSSRPAPARVRGTGRSRRPKTPEPRSASWSSPEPPASTAASRAAARSSSTSGRSTRPPQRRGCSSAATLPRPHTCACSGPGAGSACPTDTAPRVRHQSGASMPASPRAWRSTRARPTGSVPSTAGTGAEVGRETTPVNGMSRSTASASRCARAARSPSPATVTASAPASRRTRATVSSSLSSDVSGPVTTSQRPPPTVPDTSVRGRHTISYDQLSTVARSCRPRRQADRAGSTASSPLPASTPRVSATEPRSSDSTAAQKVASAASAEVGCASWAAAPSSQ